MSHFTVLVIGKNPEKQLAPFKEDLKIEFKDTEKESFSDWQTKTSPTVVFSDGRMFSKYGKEMEKNWVRSGIGFSSEDKFIVPEGAELKEVPRNQLYKTFESYMTDYCGEKRDKNTGKYGYWHNPKAKWDWHQLGGRWTGYFKVKNKLTKKTGISKTVVRMLSKTYNVEPEVIEGLVEVIKQGNFNKRMEYCTKHGIRGSYQLEKDLQDLLKPEYEDAELGESGLGAGVPKEGYADSVKIKDIDFDGMFFEAAKEAQERFEKVEKLLGGSIPKMEYLWKDLIDDGVYFAHLSIDDKRDMYHGQAAIKAVAEAIKKAHLSDDKDLLAWLKLDDYQVTKEQYVAQAKANALSTFAVLKDGEWFEKGEMGWFGCVSNEMDQQKWNDEFNKLIQDLPGDTLVSVYDCHI